MPNERSLICGCRICGCVCQEHAPEGVEILCARHVDLAVFRFIADEARRLVVLALFVAVIAGWAVILVKPAQTAAGALF